jgi:putative endonuclease
MPKISHVYIITNKPNGILYVGVTADLSKRIWEHKNRINKGFASKYNLDKLVFNEYYEDIEEAIVREKQLKNWQRDWKVQLIEKHNPGWDDLYLTINC